MMFWLGIIIFIVAFVLGVIAGNQRKAALDNQGEAAVRRWLAQYFNGPNYHLLNNITLPTKDGTTQIDHILISTKGIFVIEAKHYSGLILASTSSPTWSQAFHKRSYQFQNPIRQNFKHVKAVQALLEFIPPEHIYSMVIFTSNARFKGEMPQGVFDLYSAVNYLRLFTEDVITDNRLQFCVGRLECKRKSISGQTDVEHQAHLNKKFGELS